MLIRILLGQNVKKFSCIFRSNCMAKYVTELCLVQWSIKTWIVAIFPPPSPLKVWAPVFINVNASQTRLFMYNKWGLTLLLDFFRPLPLKCAIFFLYSFGPLYSLSVFVLVFIQLSGYFAVYDSDDRQKLLEAYDDEVSFWCKVHKEL